MKYRPIRFLASVKFAIPVIFLFVVAMIVGTVCESRYGTDFAKVGVYQTWWFYLIMGSMATSVLLAFLDRIPFRKRLTGFYIVHIALLVLMFGSLVTRYYGIDGNITLNPGPNGLGPETGTVRLSEDTFSIYVGETRIWGFELPQVVTPRKLDASFQLPTGGKITLLDYMPYAKQDSTWKPEKGSWAQKWELKSARFDQNLQLSNLAGDENFPTHIEIGLLQVMGVEAGLWEGLLKSLAEESGSYAFFDQSSGQVGILKNFNEKSGPQTFALGNKKVRMHNQTNTKIGLSFVVAELDGKTLQFFPKYSPMPLSNHMQLDGNSPFRLIELNALRQKATVLLMVPEEGRTQMAFGKGVNWTRAEEHGEAVALPWMGMSLKLTEDHRNQAPVPALVQAVPQKEAEQNMRAVRVRLDGVNGQPEGEGWITDRGRSQLPGQFEAVVDKAPFELPFKFALERFKMDRVPGTMDPASYESFVRVSTSSDPIHIYMNHPYKSNGYTFYQASYFEGEGGEFHTVLSVNKDPGRPIKYLGSLILVSGLIIYFLTLYGYLFPLPGKEKNG